MVMVVPNNQGFPTKNDHFEVFWRYHHLRKHPYTHKQYICIISRYNHNLSEIAFGITSNKVLDAEGSSEFPAHDLGQWQ